MEAVIKSPRATIDFSPVSITRATHSHDSGQTRVRISGSRRAGCRRMVEFVLRASTNIDCGKEKRRGEREREGTEFVERRHRFTVENVADPRPRI